MPSDRAQPILELEGDALINLLLDEIEEDDRLSQAMGIDLSPPAPDPKHAPLVCPPLDVWIRRAEEVHELRERAWRAARRQKKG
jgi:hypothetical protein